MAKLVLLIQTYDIPEAHCVRSMLSAYGVICHVADDHFARMNWTHLIAIGGVRVMVADDELEEDQALLSHPVTSVNQRSDVRMIGQAPLWASAVGLLL